VKRLVELLRERAKELLPECGDCGGRGEVANPEDAHSREDVIIPCPTCAPLREMAEWCIHDNKYWLHPAYNDFTNGKWGSLINFKYPCRSTKCIVCNKFLWEQVASPTFTVQTLRTALETLGELFGFVSHVAQTISDIFDQQSIEDSAWYVLEVTFEQVFAEIILNHMAEAVESYMEGRVKG
jgi:hypothetical protein